ncbi:hypothetical protein [Burkholderia contaminans]|uniref:Uncharacterized protein n=2 Tax=Burkholderia cepacia complex TaxID=87882 RepID=A0A2S5DM76_9BURK|nr:hypothetical protein [Burkholderia contaminans]POZ80194.1 hypothetical protein C3743_40155 [Burkholderia contaminans]
MGWLRNSRGEGEDEPFDQSDDPSDVPPPSDEPEAGNAKSASPATSVPDLHLPAELHLLRDLLATNAWSDGGAAGMVQWTMIESEIRNALDIGLGNDVQNLWRQYAPADHQGLDSILADRARTRQQLNIEREAQPAAFPATAGNAGASAGAGVGQGSASAAAGTTAGATNGQAGMSPAEPLKPIFQDFIDVESKIIPNSPFADPYKTPNWPEGWPMPPRPANSKDDAPSPQTAPQTATQPGATDLLSKAVSLPFGLLGGTGSLIAGSLKALSGTAKSFYVKNRINGYHVLGSQLEDSAERISNLAAGLRKDGLGDMLQRMKAEGRPAKEIFEGMRPGGRFEEYADGFANLMADKSFAQRYDDLLKEVRVFDQKASRYAKTGMELNEDFSEVIDKTVGRVSEATEGFPSKVGEAFEHLQDMVRDIGERIAKMVSRLLNRFSPSAA